MQTSRRTAPFSVIQYLYSSTYAFEFPQAVRLLQGLDPRKRLGTRDNPRLDPVYFRAHIDFAVSSSDLKKLLPGNPPELTVNFTGIAGIQGPLPEVFTEILIDRIKLKDEGFRDFLDIFNHRLITLWFGLFCKIYPSLKDAPLEETDIGQSLMDVGGVRFHEYGRNLLPFGALLWDKTRSALGLQRTVESYFNIPCCIHSLMGGWNRVDKEERTRLGRQHHELGRSSILGGRSFNQSKGFRMTLGPLDYTRFCDFLPIATRDSGYAHLKSLVCAYFDKPPHFSIELVLKKDDVPAADLSSQYALGRNAWLNHRRNFSCNGTAVINERDL